MLLALAGALAAGLDTRPAAAHSEPITVEVFVTPAEPAPDEDVELLVVLTGAVTESPVFGADVSVKADMPAHSMTPVEVDLMEGDERNEYVGSLRFTMPGSWEITVHVRHQGESDRASFEALVKGPGAARDRGTGSYSLTLDFPAGRSGYRGWVLSGVVSLMALVVALAWMNKRAWGFGRAYARGSAGSVQAPVMASAGPAEAAPAYIPAIPDRPERAPPSGPVRAWAADYIARTREFSRNANLYVLHVIGMDMIHGSWSVLFNLYLLELGYDIRFVGMRLIVEGAASTVTAVPGGMISDRIGRKASFVVGDGMGALISLILIGTRDETLLLTLPALSAFFGNLHHTSEAAFMMENSRPVERVHLFAVAGSLRTLSSMVGALVAGFIPLLFVDQVGRIDAYRWAVYGGLALWFLSLIPALLLRSYEAEERPERQASQAEVRGVGRLRGLFADIRHPRHVSFFVLTSAMIAFGFGAVGPMFNVAFHEGHVHAADSDLGFMFAVGQLSLAVATFLVPVLAARMLKTDAIAVTRLLSLPFVLAMGLLPVLLDEGWLLLLLVGTSYAGRTMIFRMAMPLDDAFNMEVLDARERATSTGMELALGGGMSAIAIFLGSRLMDAGDFTTPFLLMALATGGATLIYWWAFRGTEMELLRAADKGEAGLQLAGVAD